MTLSERIRRHPFRWFYGIAFSIGAALWTYAVVHQVLWPDYGGPGIPLSTYFFAERAQVMAEHPYWTAHSDGLPLYVMSYWRVPAVSPFLFFPGAPTTAALLVTGMGWGRQGLGALLSLYRPILGAQSWRDGVRLYAALLLMIAGAAGVSTALALLELGDVARPVIIKAYGLQSSGTLLAAWVVALFMNQGGLLEELGWRGFGWPYLARKLANPLVAAIVLGTLWALWHFPREVPPLLGGQNTVPIMLLGQVLFITICISMTIVAVYFVNLAGGSVWPAIIVHGSFNILFAGLQFAPDNAQGVEKYFSHSTWIWMIGAAIVLIVAGKDLGWSTRLRLHGGDGRTDPSRLWSEREDTAHVA